ncbi:membrane-bound lytic murein transglycosylase B [Kibdelosporangium banguiense]|uniref:Membrane-bound lytic murein transglycosylase B n=1 Tax=Kibdelosporangium banguiense TaxID=1365924 RepID=A0ABS4T936_9PSEU|nr:lytic murein transglycosylase [Kibdelosporangium banguiense]MBP2320940.1 membrane-bound lytic murein transglycosylase B [Kibdelosporangium banguiense]
MPSPSPLAAAVPPPPRPRRRSRVPKLLVIALLLVGMVVATYFVLMDIDLPGPKQPEFPVPEINAEARVAVPFQAPPVDMAAVPAMARKMEIPERVLMAYARAEERQRAATPRCGISWTLLAGIGRKESRHARFGGATVEADGKLSKPIIGIPLNGSQGVRAIKDTDGGELDGDVTWDRAVGPMQFLPATWKRWAVRASGDGAPADPQNIDDAAASAARYLCSGGRDLTSGRGWWAAVMAYNTSVDYAREVFSGQDAYSKAV